MGQFDFYVFVVKDVNMNELIIKVVNIVKIVQEIDLDFEGVKVVGKVMSYILCSDDLEVVNFFELLKGISLVEVEILLLKGCLCIVVFVEVLVVYKVKIKQYEELCYRFGLWFGQCLGGIY